MTAMKEVMLQIRELVRQHHQKMTQGEIRNKKLRIKIHGLDVDSIEALGTGLYLIHGLSETTNLESTVICEYFVPTIVLEPSDEERPAIGFKLPS